MERKPNLDMNVFRARRKRLAETSAGSAFVLPARPEFLRNGSVQFPYRQDSNFYYLTGFEEPGSVLVLRPGLTPELVLFVRPKDPLKELWTGFIYGPEGAARDFHADEAYPIDEFNAKIVELLKPVERVFYPLKWNPEFDAQLMESLEKVRLSQGRSGLGLLPIHDPNGPIGELRVIKSEDELQLMRKAAQISAVAHREVMKATRPGVNERYLTGVFLGTILKEGCQREGYGSILATGANATCLHYVFNDQDLREGEIFLIDAAGEYKYYTADITRSYPVSGKFTDVQGRFYERILEAQKSLIEMVRPGLPYADLQATTIEKLTDIMIDFKLLKSRREDAIRNQEFRKYYPHNVGHYLGMDVHDQGLYQLDNQSRPLQAGMVITIEPGIYVPPEDTSAPAELRGIGIRIEDDIIVTPRGHENMTAYAPKEIADLESLIGKA